LGSDAFVGADHRFIRCWQRCVGPMVSETGRGSGLPCEVKIT
jgi:hypothetical protein